MTDTLSPPTSNVDLYPFDRYSRRQSVILQPKTRLILVAIAQHDGSSLSGLIVRMIAAEIQRDDYYATAQQIVKLALSIEPKKKCQGQPTRATDDMPQPRITGSRPSRFAVPLPVTLNEFVFQLARGHNLSIPEYLLSLVERAIAQHPHTPDATKLANAQIRKWKKSGEMPRSA